MSSNNVNVKTFYCLTDMIQLAKLIQNTDVKLGLGKEHQSWSMTDISLLPLLTPLQLTVKAQLNIVSSEVIFS